MSIQVKRRNMERLCLCCGGNALNSFYDMTEADLGYAGQVIAAVDYLSDCCECVVLLLLLVQ